MERGTTLSLHSPCPKHCIAGALNGSTLTYYFDCDPVSGLPTGNKSWLIDALVTLDTGLSEFLRHRLLVILLPQFVRDWVWQFGPHTERWIDFDGFVIASTILPTISRSRRAAQPMSKLTTHPAWVMLTGRASGIAR